MGCWTVRPGGGGGWEGGGGRGVWVRDDSGSAVRTKRK